ncbi:hypothetical protein [Methylobacterium gnaphalii]|uniref:Uncharacterized protein n=1 Tax=Methylobacterium gnaphalii TaxID=1010610 RepID=A0A512JPA8_9HYPH|nr:hypothetical protein [Methylobacterium gnaphalii]GEP11794.1 hypothetical protein MGN01_36390 [Methylobacterium gnaphalii]GJD69471.1 hypothetical protein MMMDOFMJ_2402 [Methylobacterium gnaphalii]GLS49571.1 hypothetical protein GCM10007885_24200 [Methylobacterium gnaphalii]
MSLVPAVKHDDPRTRAALLDYLSDKLRSLYPFADLRGWLAGHLAPLANHEIAFALKGSPELTAGRLADALLRTLAQSDPSAVITTLIGETLPHLPRSQVARLAEFTRAVREIAIQCDGQVDEVALRAAGFGATEAARLMPDASRIIASLNERRASNVEPERNPAKRLMDAGSRAAAQHAARFYEAA